MGRQAEGKMCAVYSETNNPASVGLNLSFDSNTPECDL